MKIEEFMDALNGVDPKYIEESAIEFKEDALGQILEFRKQKAAKRRRIYGSCITAAACVLLILLASKTDFFRMSKHAGNDTAMAPESMMIAMEEAVTEDNSGTIMEAEAVEEFLHSENQDANVSALPEIENTIDALPEKALEESDSTTAIVWQPADFVKEFLVEASDERLVVMGEQQYPFTVQTSEKACDVGGLSAVTYGQYDVIYAKDFDQNISYAYFSVNGSYYLILAQDLDDEIFRDGCSILMQEL